MRQRFITPLVLLLSFAACEQPGTAPSEGAVFAETKKPSMHILRFQDHFATSWTGEGSSLRATHTTFPIPESFDPFIPETNCGPQEDLALIDYKRVGVENLVDFFASEFHLKVQGDVWIIVRDLSQVGDCYGVKLVAQGPGTIRYNDNDWFGVVPGEKATNAWSFKASGTLMTPDGRQLRYQGSAHYTVKVAGGEPEFTRIREIVNVR